MLTVNLVRHLEPEARIPITKEQWLQMSPEEHDKYMDLEYQRPLVQSEENERLLKNILKKIQAATDNEKMPIFLIAKNTSKRVRETLEIIEDVLDFQFPDNEYRIINCQIFESPESGVTRRFYKSAFRDIPYIFGFRRFIQRLLALQNPKINPNELDKEDQTFQKNFLNQLEISEEEFAEHTDKPKREQNLETHVIYFNESVTECIREIHAVILLLLHDFPHIDPNNALDSLEFFAFASHGSMHQYQKAGNILSSEADGFKGDLDLNWSYLIDDFDFGHVQKMQFDNDGFWLNNIKTIEQLKDPPEMQLLHLGELTTSKNEQNFYEKFCPLNIRDQYGIESPLSLDFFLAPMDAIERNRSREKSVFFISASPGGGKTTSAKFLYHEAINNFHKFAYIPIYIPLNTIQDKEHFNQQLLEYNNKYPRNNLLFLLDGFDELKKDKEGISKSLLTQKLNDTDKLRKTKYIVCGRNFSELNFSEKDAEEAEFILDVKHLRLNTFNEIKSKYFVLKYFVKNRENENKKNITLQLIQDHRFAQIIKNPLLLEMLCFLVVRGDINSIQAIHDFNICDFYKITTEALISYWEMNKDIQTTALQVFDDKKEEIKSKSINLIEFIAGNNIQTKTKLEKQIEAGNLPEISLNDLGYLHYSKVIVEQTDGEFKFVHETFREFIKAKYYFKNPEEFIKYCDKIGDIDFEREVELGEKDPYDEWVDSCEYIDSFLYYYLLLHQKELRKKWTPEILYYFVKLNEHNEFSMWLKNPGYLKIIYYKWRNAAIEMKEEEIKEIIESNPTTLSPTELTSTVKKFQTSYHNIRGREKVAHEEELANKNLLEEIEILKKTNPQYFYYYLSQKLKYIAPHCRLNNEDLIEMAQNANLPQLINLDISFGAFNDFGFKIFIEHGHRFPSLARIDVSFTEISFQSLETLLENSHNFPNLSSLNFKNTYFTNAEKFYFLSQLDRFPKLKKENVKFNPKTKRQKKDPSEIPF